MTQTPKPPNDLEPRGRGRRFWTQTTKDYDLSAAEAEILSEVCRTLDEIEALRAVVASEGVTSTGAAGQVVSHPALVELRQSRAELRRLIAEMQLPALDDPGETTVPKARTLRARKAAETRWSLHGRS